VLYPAERVIVEVDSVEFHSDRDSFERDRHRDAIMLEADYLTVRITDQRMKRTARAEARRLNAILERRRRAA
jgi:very-short-patch-repair endonuclease